MPTVTSAQSSPRRVLRTPLSQWTRLRYEAVNAMLLNEFLKEHRKVEQQATTIAQQRKDFQANITLSLKRLSRSSRREWRLSLRASRK